MTTTMKSSFIGLCWSTLFILTTVVPLTCTLNHDIYDKQISSHKKEPDDVLKVEVNDIQRCTVYLVLSSCLLKEDQFTINVQAFGIGNTTLHAFKILKENTFKDRLPRSRNNSKSSLNLNRKIEIDKLFSCKLCDQNQRCCEEFLTKFKLLNNIFIIDLNASDVLFYQLKNGFVPNDMFINNHSLFLFECSNISNNNRTICIDDLLSIFKRILKSKSNRIQHKKYYLLQIKMNDTSVLKSDRVKGFSFRKKLFNRLLMARSLLILELIEPNNRTLSLDKYILHILEMQRKLVERHDEGLVVNQSQSIPKKPLSRKTRSNSNPSSSFTQVQYERVGGAWIPKFNETAYNIFLAHEELNRTLRKEAEWAYLCMVFLIILVLFAIWGLRGFHSRNTHTRLVTHSDKNHYLTVKEVLYRKAAYLPMFTKQGPLEEVFVHDCGTNTTGNSNHTRR